MCSIGTTVLPTGKSEAIASFTCAQAKGMPMIEQASPMASEMWLSASYQPASTNQITLPIRPIVPVPMSSRP